MYKKAWFIILVIFIFAAGALILARGFSGEDDWICVSNEWVKHGNPSAPMPTSGCEEVEISNDLPTSTIGNAGCNDLKNVDWSIEEPIISPLKLTGEAKGSWFFEASFPVFLVNWDGLIIAQGVAQAKSDWMTTDFVPFEVNLEFIKPDYKNNGAIILKKDNPSGLPQNDASCELPILFEGVAP